MEDVPDMAVKFAVYETLRPIHARLTDGRQVWVQRGREGPGAGRGAAPGSGLWGGGDARVGCGSWGRCSPSPPDRPPTPTPTPTPARPPPPQPSTVEDLLMGGTAGAAAAAATTPLDVIKTRMMCSASSKPTLRGAVRGIIAEGGGARAFFRGVGPRALSNGINSAVFFCFFEAFRRVLVQRQAEAAARKAAAGGPPMLVQQAQQRRGRQPQAELAEAGAAAQAQQQQEQQQQRWWRRQRQGGGEEQQQLAEALAGGGGRGGSGGGAALACLSLALPVGPSPPRWW
jgi:hypothetical protein